MPHSKPTSQSHNQDSPMRMLRMPAVIQRTGLSRSTIYALAATGKFPRQIKISKSAAAWLASEVDAYLAERIAERDGVSA